MADTQTHPNYTSIWAWLVVLLAVSVAAVYLPFSQTITVAFVFAVAAAKAALVGLYFMHLRFEEKLVRWIAAVPIMLFVIMTLSLIPDIVYNR